MLPATSRDVVEYNTATKLARQYEHSANRIDCLIKEIGSELEKLSEVFQSTFDLYVTTNRSSWSNTTDFKEPGASESAANHLHLEAWRILVNKLGIRKLLSSKRRDQLDKLLEKGSVTHSDGTVETLPAITEETIIAVLGGLANCAESFLEEAIREEYDYWKPYRKSQYKTNQQHDFKLESKLIREMAFSTWTYGGKRQLCGGISHYVQPHLIALDNIFHCLDGKGPLSGYCGPFVDAINLAYSKKQLSAETEYFRAKWFQNGNLHLIIKRQDLLDKFNLICGRNRLAKAV